jgi:hypothetical protein
MGMQIFSYGKSFLRHDTFSTIRANGFLGKPLMALFACQIFQTWVIFYTLPRLVVLSCPIGEEWQYSIG